MQSIFSDLEYATKKKVTRRDRFLGEINAVRTALGNIAQGPLLADLSQNVEVPISNRSHWDSSQLPG